MSTSHSNKRPTLQPWQYAALGLVAYDFITLCLSYFLALWLRFDCIYSQIPPEYLAPYRGFIYWYAFLCILIFWRLRLYNSMWRFASYRELGLCCLATMITVPLHYVLINFFYRRMPISYHVFGGIIQLVFILCSRFFYRFAFLMQARLQHGKGAGKSCSRGMLIGAGSAGQLVLRDFITSQHSTVKICCIIDDDSNKWKRSLEGVPIVGGRNSILANVKKYRIDQIFLAIPTVSAQAKRDIIQLCQQSNCELMTLPGLYQLANKEVSVNQMKPVAVEDLLGREEVEVNLDEIADSISGRKILVTGGGGSIGSELCRQLAGYKPAQLIILDIYENNAYDIEQELKQDYPDLNLLVLIGSVQDSRRINSIFEQHRPAVVFHAAAHKHVPLMENSPCEAIKNNVIGTYKTARAALLHGCERFVFISTDKAVNPTNIMGASKRLCEMVIQTMDKVRRSGKWLNLPPLHSHKIDVLDNMRLASSIETPSTEFVAVRFGNVLGSNGSVIPLFKKQIENGGPVTVTHPEIIRYFMTIPEAVSLVLQAACYAEGGEIFVLDMGAPMKIADLARNLIRLSGYKPDIDIKIEYIGLRPGEKLYEEKLMAEEGLQTTDNKLIHIGKPLELDSDKFLHELEHLAEICFNNDGDVCNTVKKIVCTYMNSVCDKDNPVYQEQLKQCLHH